MSYSFKDRLINFSKIRIKIEMPRQKQGLEKTADELLKKGRELIQTLSRDERLAKRTEQLRATSHRLSQKSRQALEEAKKHGKSRMERLKKQASGSEKQNPPPTAQ